MLVRGLEVRQRPVYGEPRIQVAAKPIAHFTLRCGGQQIYAQVRRPDSVGLIDDQIASVLEPTGRPRECERDKQAKQRKYGAFDDPGPRPRPISFLLQAT